MRVARLKKWTEKFFFVEHDEEVMCLICAVQLKIRRSGFSLSSTRLLRAIPL